MRKTIDTEHLKEIQVLLLEELDRYCKNNGLTYFLAFGTLIGAIRHKGYIPWDDDIDVIMPRIDYEKFITSYNSERGKKISAKVLSHKLDNNYYLPFAKLVDTNTVIRENVNIDYEIGVYIDIFPLDNLNNDLAVAMKRIKIGHFYNNLWQLKIISFNRLRSIFKNMILLISKIILFFIPIGLLISKIDEYSYNKRDNENRGFTNYLGVIVGSPYVCCFRKEWFEKSTKVLFEGRYYSAPIGSDALLREIYGDYMQLPPEEKRVSHHSFTAWYKTM